jgi:hypothetical protein
VILIALLLASAPSTEQQVRQAMKVCDVPQTWLKRTHDGKIYFDPPLTKAARFDRLDCVFGQLQKRPAKYGYIGRPVP